MLLLGLLTSETGHATNGLNLIGSGGISSALAGADTALATDFTAMNTNPAGMVQIRGQHAGLSISMLKPELKQKDALNDQPGQNDPLIIPNLGYIRHLSGTPFTVGVGFFTIGGNATDFRALQTSVGTRDKTGTQLRHFKFAPSIAYEVTDKFSVGAALAISYSDISLTVFPNTPALKGFETTGACDRTNAISPPGMCAYALAFVPKFGAMYKPNEMVTFGIAYTMRANLPYDDGQIAVNQAGIGRVTYDAKVMGFKWPDDIAFGIALRPRKDWLIAAKFQWINWDAALNNVQIELRNGDNPAKPTDSLRLDYKWRDQYVAAIGANYDMNEQLSVRGGYNFGNNPIPAETINPTNANIIEHHVVGGLQYRFTKALWLDGNFTYAVPKQHAYNSVALPSNPNIRVGGYDLLFTLSYWR